MEHTPDACEFEQTGHEEWRCKTHDVVMVQRNEPNFCSTALGDVTNSLLTAPSRREPKPKSGEER